MSDDVKAEVAATDATTDAAAAESTDDTTTTTAKDDTAADDDADATKTDAADKADDAAKLDDAAAAAAQSEADADYEIEQMKRRVAEMEEEAKKIEAMHKAVDATTSKMNADGAAGDGEKSGGRPASGPEVDARSIYVAGVDYKVTPQELTELFNSCGAINRVTIVCDKYTGRSKGFAYVEFEQVDAIANAMILDDTEFKGRQIKITPKRTNVPGYHRGRGGYGGGRGRGGGRRRRYHDPYAYDGGGGGGYGGGYGPPRRRFRSRHYAPY